MSEHADADFVTEELLAVRRDGTRAVVTVRVGKPVKDTRADEDSDKCPYVCLIQCDGTSAKPKRVFGEGPMQALHLGLMMLRLDLECEESDGVRFIWPDGEPHDWGQFWFGIKRPTEPADTVPLTLPRAAVDAVTVLPAPLVDRMHHLLERNTDGTLSANETAELETLVSMAQFSQLVSLAVQASSD